MKLHVTLSGDVFLKSRRTQVRLVKRVSANLAAALVTIGHSGESRRIAGHRFEVETQGIDPGEIAAVASRLFGVAGVEHVTEIDARDLDTLVTAVAKMAGPAVTGKTFAVRPKRSGNHTWRSRDLAIRLGDRLRQAGGRVDLTNPEITVKVTVIDDLAFLVSDRVEGVGGLPIGTQEPVLCLISGGFDSVVAAWMMMSRGCDVEFVHFTLNCAQSDHAMAVARELWIRWGYGMDPTVHLVEFQPVKEALLASVDSRMRQITLKVLMAKAADAIASERRIQALVTGDALGQVSSQTLPHLVAVSKAIETPMLRPLVGLPKETIIDLARMVGTAEMSARAREVCDLSEGGPVATAARAFAIAASLQDVPDVLMNDAVATRKSFLLRDWVPGSMTTAESSSLP